MNIISLILLTQLWSRNYELIMDNELLFLSKLLNDNMTLIVITSGCYLVQIKIHESVHFLKK